MRARRGWTGRAFRVTGARRLRSITALLAVLAWTSGLAVVASPASAETTAVMVKDIYSEGSSYPDDLTAIGSTLFFAAYDGIGYELWKSDGTAAGTTHGQGHLLGAGGSAPSELTELSGGTLFFVADDGTNGRELWKSDGTEAGTVLVKDIVSGASGSDPVPAHRPSAARCSSWPTTARTATSSGRATAPRPAPSW